MENLEKSWNFIFFQRPGKVMEKAEKKAVVMEKSWKLKGILLKNGVVVSFCVRIRTVTGTLFVVVRLVCSSDLEGDTGGSCK